MGVVLQEFIADVDSGGCHKRNHHQWQPDIMVWLGVLKHVETYSIFEWLKGIKVENGCNEFDSVEWLNEIDSVDPVKKG